MGPGRPGEHIYHSKTDLRIFEKFNFWVRTGSPGRPAGSGPGPVRESTKKIMETGNMIPPQMKNPAGKVPGSILPTDAKISVTFGVLEHGDEP